MKYLFFDTECANCFDGEGKICEFGFVLTDENYKIIEKDNIIINPESPFDKKGLGMSKIKLALPYSAYSRHGNFVSVYRKIKSLFEGEVIAIGHNTPADAQYLLYACERYNLKPFDYKFVDTQKAVRDLYERATHLKLIELHNEFCSLNEKQSHTGIDDAIRTMEVARFVEKDKRVSPKALIALYPKSCGEVFMGRVIEHEFNLLPYSQSSKLTNKKNRKIFSEFVASMPKSASVYSFPSEYERDAFPQMMVIVNHLKSIGRGYSDQVKKTTYVTFNPNEYKLRFAQKCRIITFPQFLSEVGLSESELESPDILPIVASMPEHKEWYESYLRAHGKKE